MQTVILMAWAVRRAPLRRVVGSSHFKLAAMLRYSVLFGLCLLAGCGGSPEPSPQPTATRTSDPKATEIFDPAGPPKPGAPTARRGPQVAPRDVGPLAGGFPAQGSGQGKAGEAAEQTAEEKVPARPENAAEWSFADLATARVDGDLKLLDAVNHLIDGRGDEDEVIQVLLSLLEIDPPEEPAEDEAVARPTAGRPGAGPPPFGIAPGDRFGPRGRQQDVTPLKHRFVSPEVASRIIEGLGTSSAAVATDALKNLIVGKQPAPLPEQNIMLLAIGALSTNLVPEKEALLLGLLMTPDVAQPAKFTDSAGPAQRYGGRRRGNTRQRDYPGHAGPAGPSSFPPGGRGGGSRRSAGRGAMLSDGGLNPEWIQDEVAAVAGHQFSKDSRVKLAKFLNSPDVVVETAELLEGILSEDDPRNDPAQILLLTNPYTDQETRKLVEEVLIQSSSKSLLEMLAISESQLNSQSGSRSRAHGRSSFAGPAGMFEPHVSRSRPGSRKQPGRNSQNKGRPSRRSSREAGSNPSHRSPAPVAERIDPDERRQQQRSLLWRPKVVSMLHDALQQTEFQGVDSRLPLLMGTIPITPARNALSDVFDQHEGQDPKALFDMGMFSSTTLDPVALIFGKSVYHQQDSGAAAGKGPADDWSKRMEIYVVDLCQRFEMAARKAQSDGGKTASVKRFPVRLHDRGKTVARYDLRWPEDVAKSWKRYDIAPLELHYIRLEEEGVANQMVHHYRHHNRDARETKINGGVWFDSFDSKDQKSVDVLVTTRDGNLGVPVGEDIKKSGPRKKNQRSGRQPAKRGERKTLVVEILTVAIPQEKEAS